MAIQRADLRVGSLKGPTFVMTSRKETLEILVQNYFPDCLIIDNHTLLTPNVREKQPKREDWKVQTLRGTVNSFHPYISPGEDVIFPTLLQFELENLLFFIHKTFQGWYILPL